LATREIYFAAGLAAAPAGLVGLELGTRFGGALLQLFLQLLLGFLKNLRIGRRAVIGLGEFRQRQRQSRRAVGVDRLDHQVLALFEVGISSGVTS